MTSEARAARMLRIRTITQRAAAMHAAAASQAVVQSDAQLTRLVALARATAPTQGLATGAQFAAAAECAARLNAGHASVARRRTTELDSVTIATTRLQKAKSDAMIAERFAIRMAREAERAAEHRQAAHLPHRDRAR